MRLFLFRTWLIVYLSLFIFAYSIYGADVVITPTGVCSPNYKAVASDYLDGASTIRKYNTGKTAVYSGVTVPFLGWNTEKDIDIYGDAYDILSDSSSNVQSFKISRAYHWKTGSSSWSTTWVSVDTVGFICKIELCPDGGPQLNGSCDRSCDDVGMGSLSTPIIGGGIDTICVHKPSNEQRQEECLIKCGSSSNINSFSYNVVDGSSRCYCSEQENNPFEEQTDSDIQTKKNNGEDTLLAELNQQIRESNNTSNELSNDTNSLLSELIDSQTSNLDFLNTDLTSSLDTLNTDLTAKLDETNEILNDSKDIQEETKDGVSDIYDAISAYLSWYFDNEAIVTDKITDSDININLSDLETNIKSVDTDGYDFSDVDFNSGQKGFINTVVSKYSNVLGFSSSYGARPDNFTIFLYGNNYTLLDFGLLDPFVSILRNLFLTIAYFGGFMIFIRRA